MGALARVGVRGLVGVDTESDPGDPNRYVMFVGQSGSACPTRPTTARTSTPRSARPIRATSAGCSGWPGSTIRHQAQQIVELETDIAACHWDKVKTRDMTPDVQPDVAHRLQRRQSGAALADVHGRRRHRRAAHGRAGRGAAVLLHRGRRPADRAPAADLEGLAQVAGDRLVRAVPVERHRRRRTSPSTAPRCRAPRSCGSGGSAGSVWSRAPSARPSARSTSSGTSPRWPSSGWTSWWPT